MQYDIAQSTTSQLTGTVKDFQIGNARLDEGTSGGRWTNEDFVTFFKYYSNIPQLKQAVDSLAMWSTGRGYTCDAETQVILDHIQGWGEDSFDTIMRNMLIIKKINGDAYAEIIREGNTIINLKPLNPSNVTVLVNEQGMIEGYEHRNGDGKVKKIKRADMFHISNMRVANQIHGTSVIPSIKYIIDWRQEVMEDYRRTLHRSTIRVLYVQLDDNTRITTLRQQYAEAMSKGEVLILPAKPGEVELQDYTAPNPEIFMAVIRYLDSIFYEALGIPKIILGGSQEYTQADSKMGYLTFQQVWASEQRELEEDIWGQLYLRVQFERPIDLKDKVASDEAANTTETGFQNNDTNSNVTRSE